MSTPVVLTPVAPALDALVSTLGEALVQLPGFTGNHLTGISCASMLASGWPYSACIISLGFAPQNVGHLKACRGVAITGSLADGYDVYYARCQEYTERAAHQCAFFVPTNRHVYLIATMDHAGEGSPYAFAVFQLIRRPVNGTAQTMYRGVNAMLRRGSETQAFWLRSLDEFSCMELVSYYGCRVYMDGRMLEHREADPTLVGDVTDYHVPNLGFVAELPDWEQQSDTLLKLFGAATHKPERSPAQAIDRVLD